MSLFKTELRRQHIAARLDLSRTEIEERSAAMVKHLRSWELWNGFENIAAFKGFRGEPELDAAGEGKRLFYPRMQDDGLTLRFFEVFGPGDFEQNRWGLLEPRGDTPELDLNDHPLILVPALALDPHGYRLGYGKGFYDRFLANKKLISVAFCYQSEWVAAVPREDHDQPVPFLCTEAGLQTAHAF